MTSCGFGAGGAGKANGLASGVGFEVKVDANDGVGAAGKYDESLMMAADVNAGGGTSV